MGRKNLRDQRRAEIVEAFGRVLADHGYAAATVQAVAAEAGLAPGLLHHYFTGKGEMLHELLNLLLRSFRGRLAASDELPEVENYLSAALKLGQGAHVLAAKCWVGLFAEAMRDPSMLAKIRRHLDSEISFLGQRSGGKLSTDDCSAILAYVLGCLVFGAFAPKKTEGFAFRGAEKLLKGLV